MVFSDILTPVLAPFFSYGVVFGIVVVSLMLAVIVTLVYKYTTNQTRMRELKGDLKKMQAEIKLNKEPEKMMQMQKEMMGKNGEYMKLSFKPTLFTFIPLILIFGWMSQNLAYEPVAPGEQFTVSADFGSLASNTIDIDTHGKFKVVDQAEKPPSSTLEWRLEAINEGKHIVDLVQGDVKFPFEVIVSNEQKPVEKGTSVNDAKIVVNYDKLTPFGLFSIFGWRPGWLALYIFSFTIFSLILRKSMKLA